MACRHNVRYLDRPFSRPPRAGSCQIPPSWWMEPMALEQLDLEKKKQEKQEHESHGNTALGNRPLKCHWWSQHNKHYSTSMLN